MPDRNVIAAAAWMLLLSSLPASAAEDRRSAGPPDPGSARLLAEARPYFQPFDLSVKDGTWWVTVFAGAVAKNELSSIVFKASPDFGESYVAGASLGKEFGAVSDALRLEWMATTAVVFGTEDYVDLRFEVGARWIRFPWNDTLFTTIGAFIGPSYLTKRSIYEDEEKNEFSHFKNGLSVEFTFAHPQRPGTALVARFHHRSSIFGLIPDAGTPSDFLTLGIKKRF